MSEIPKADEEFNRSIDIALGMVNQPTRETIRNTPTTNQTEGDQIDPSLVTPEQKTSKSKRALTATAYVAGTAALIGGGFVAANAVFDNLEHRATYNKQLNEDEVQEQLDNQRELDNGKVVTTLKPEDK